MLLVASLLFCISEGFGSLWVIYHKGGIIFHPSNYLISAGRWSTLGISHNYLKGCWEGLNPVMILCLQMKEISAVILTMISILHIDLLTLNAYIFQILMTEEIQLRASPIYCYISEWFPCSHKEKYWYHTRAYNCHTKRRNINMQT